MQRPDVVIVFPPPMDRIARIYPAPHFLSSFINGNGFRARPLDLNMAVLCRMTDASRVNRTIEALSIEKKTLEREDKLSKRQRSRYVRLLRGLAGLRYARKHRLHARRGARLMRMENKGIRYTRVFMEIFLNTFESFYDDPVPKVNELASRLDSPDCMELNALLADDMDACIVRPEVPVVGFSIPFGEQLVPALSLARHIKKNLPRVHVCFGGPVITLLPWPYLNGLIDQGSVDSCVKYDGKQPLLERVSAVRGTQVRPGVGNGPERRTEPGPAAGTRGRPPSARRLPVNRQDRFQPDAIRHIPRQTPIPIVQSTGCYWGRCTFCDYVNLHRDKTYRPRTVADIVEDIRYYARMNFSNFRMLTEAIPPEHAVAIARALIDARLEIEWHAFLRVDRRFSVESLETLKESGFTFTLGMESADDRVLKTLNKGYNQRVILEFIEKMRLASYSGNHLNIMVGVPGTSYARDLATYRLCETWRDVFSRFKSFVFTLTGTSEMGRNPERYGLTIVDDGGKARPGQSMRPTALQFVEAGGMRTQEKNRLLSRYRRLNEMIQHTNRIDHPAASGPARHPAAVMVR